MRKGPAVLKYHIENIQKAGSNGQNRAQEGAPAQGQPKIHQAKPQNARVPAEGVHPRIINGRFLLRAQIGFVKGQGEKQGPDHQEKACRSGKKSQDKNRLPPHKAGLPLIKETACRADGQKHSPQREEAVEEPVFQQNTVDIIQDVKNKCQTGADQEKHIPPAFKRV